MTLEEYKRLYKHFMGKLTHDGKPKEIQLVDAERMIDKAREGYGVDITVEEKVQELQPKETKSKSKK